jgi:hypothetical protein
VERFQFKHHGKLWRFAKLVVDDMTGNLLCQREWKSHGGVGALFG